MQELSILCKEFSLSEVYAKNIIELIDGGATIPFIARYRKEATGGQDDQVLRSFYDRLNYLRNLQKRRQEIEKSIEEQGKLTEELSAAITAAITLAELEDIYRPYKQKRRTRATVAIEKGLEPLAVLLFGDEKLSQSPEELAAQFIDEEKGVATAQEALQGALDIIAEWISDDAELRKILRNLFHTTGAIVTKGDAEQQSVYEMYYDYSEALQKIPSHRILAINRGEKEGFLKVSLEVDTERVMERIEKKFAANKPWLLDTCKDAYKRLIYPSLEREMRSSLFEAASEQAIAMFALNLQPLLMQPPIKNQVIMGVDPAYRTGCKIAVIDATQKVLDTTVIYPTPPQNKVVESKAVLSRLIKKHNVSVISIGNGTASKETEIFIAELLKELDVPVSYAVTNEAGASVYSASKLASEEFPNFDVTIRSAVSIARRLADPLAELVKIDPKSIGVGLYQHDMPPARLDFALNGVVESCVNAVGVDLNTASPSLLSYISGLNASIAKNIVAYREENGAFESRSTLKKVPRLGAKAYEQCAGFLRIQGGKEPLDNTAVHPESYGATRKLIEHFGYNVKDIESLGGLWDKVLAKGKEQVAKTCEIGVPTLTDILNELKKPGRDIRDELPPPVLRSDLLNISDLTPGMKIEGTVRNVIDFGAFVDIGVHQDGLVHISQIADRFIRHPSEVLKVGDAVTVKVISVDVDKKRISLTMRELD